MPLFSLNSTRAFGAAIAARLGVGLAAHEERAFEDREHKLRPPVGARRADVCVVRPIGVRTRPGRKACTAER